MRFIGGLISGILLTVSLLVTAQESTSFMDDLNIENWNENHAHLWPISVAGIKLNSDVADQAMAPSPNEGDDYPFLSLSTADPLLELTRQDISSVCIQGLSGGMNTQIYLTPEARIKVADALEGRTGKPHSFRLLDTEITTFVTSLRKLSMFRENAENFTNPVAALALDRGTASPDLMDMAEPDMGFNAPPSGIYTALSLTKQLANTNELEPCDPTEDVHAIPGYTEHLEFWEKTKALYRDGKMKQFGYDY